MGGCRSCSPLMSKSVSDGHIDVSSTSRLFPRYFYWDLSNLGVRPQRRELFEVFAKVFALPRKLIESCCAAVAGQALRLSWSKGDSMRAPIATLCLVALAHITGVSSGQLTCRNADFACSAECAQACSASGSHPALSVCRQRCSSVCAVIILLDLHNA
jgi:hypothetical protein